MADNNVMRAKSGLCVLFEWKIYRPDSVITAVIPLKHEMKTPELRLIETIASAFANVRLGEGIPLDIANQEGGPGALDPRLADSNKNDWQLIDEEQIEHGPATLFWTDDLGFLYYLPAYMTWTIRNHTTSDSCIADETIFCIRPKRRDLISLLTSEQLDATIQFLDYCASRPESLDASVATENANAIRSEMAKNAE